MDGLHERRFPAKPAVGVTLVGAGIALLWLVPAAPIVAGLAALVAGAVLLVDAFA